MNPIAAPSTLRYEPDAGLPVAIEAKSNRRTFFPTNGQTFSKSGANIIKLTLNSQSFIDFSHSYLQFTFRNAATNATCGLEQGVPFFNRLQIMSGGKELEDIQEYGRLYSILNTIQGSSINNDEHSLTHHTQFGATSAAASNVTATAVTVGDLPDNAAIATAAGANDGNQAAGIVAIKTAVDTAIETLRGKVNTQVNNAVNSQVNNGAFKYNKIDQVAAGGSVIYNVPLISAIFNINKYFPLLLTDQGLDIYLHLDNTLNVGVFDVAPDADYEIKDVKYVAHEVNLDDSFVAQMRASMSATNGVLSLSSTTYRYNLVSDTTSVCDGARDLNIAVRTKSLKGLIVKPMPDSFNNHKDVYSLSPGLDCGITSIQFRVGSVLYPQSAINYSAENKGEMFNEVRKCFGTLGAYNYGTRMNQATLPSLDANGQIAAFNVADGTGVAPKADTVQKNFIAAYDFETFAKSATESGLNTSDRALPVTMSVNRTLAGTGGGIRYDTYAMCDCIIYISQNGEIFTRI